MEGSILAMGDGPEKNRNQGLVAELECAHLANGIALTIVDPPWGKNAGNWDTEGWGATEYKTAFQVTETYISYIALVSSLLYSYGKQFALHSQVALENRPTDGKTAILVFPGEPASLADCIQAMEAVDLHVNVLSWDKTYTGSQHGGFPNYTHENIVLGWTKVCADFEYYHVHIYLFLLRRNGQEIYINNCSFMKGKNSILNTLQTLWYTCRE